MEGDEHQIKKATDEVGSAFSKETVTEFSNIRAKMREQNFTPKQALGLSDNMIEGIYGQAYRLYNTGKYKDASQLFRLLIMMNATESKYSLGLAACFHMLRDYEAAIETYTICGVIDPDSPIPYFHISDCLLQLQDKVSALIALEMALKRSGDKPEYQTLKDRALLTIESLKSEINKPKPS